MLKPNPLERPLFAEIIKLLEENLKKVNVKTSGYYRPDARRSSTNSLARSTHRLIDNNNISISNNSS